MERDVKHEQLAAAEHADPVARWRAHGAVDGARHYPATDQEVRQLAEQLEQDLAGVALQANASPAANPLRHWIAEAEHAERERQAALARDRARLEQERARFAAD